MKKVLTASTALVCAMGISGTAFAMGNAEISLSGNSKWTYHSWSDDADNGGGNNDNEFKITNSVTVDSSATSDSGLNYGTSLTLQTGGGAVNDDGMKLFIKGGFGEIRTGSGGAGDSINADATGAVEGEERQGDISRGDEVAMAGDSSISYFTPQVNGLSGGLTYSNAGSESNADSTEIAVKFKTALGGNDLSATYTQANRAASDADDAGEKSASSYGLTYSLGSLNLRVAVNSSQTDNGTSGLQLNKVSTLGFGANVDLGGGSKLGLYTVSGEDKGDGSSETEVSETALSYTYTVAPGLTTNLAYTSWEEGNASGSNVAAYIKVAF